MPLSYFRRNQTMKINIEYNRNIPIMNIEHNNSKYQLYISNDDYYVHLDRDGSTLFVSSSNLKSCIDCTKLSKNDKAFFQNIILYGSFYEVLHRSGICQELDDIGMKLLSVFLYSSLDHNCIPYNCQCDYLQLQNKLLSRMRRVNDPQLCNLKSDTVHLSEQTQCICLKLGPNEVREFDYSKYIDENNKNYFVYNLIWVLIHYYYPTEDSLLSYKEFINFMNQPDEYPYSNELKDKILKAFGNTDEIQNAFSLSPYDLFHFLYDRFNSYHAGLPSFNSKEQFINASISHLQSISLQGDILHELALLIQKP